MHDDMVKELARYDAVMPRLPRDSTIRRDEQLRALSRTLGVPELAKRFNLAERTVTNILSCYRRWGEFV